MRDVVRAAFVEFTSKFEGVVPWMYQDVKGLVTVAIGNLIDPIQYAMPLPFVDRVTGAAAGRDAIAAEWLRVKGDASLARLGHRAAERITSLRLTDEGVASLVARKLEQNDAHLRGRFPYLEEWPACAQLAVHSMAWACGPAFRFPMLEMHLRQENWCETSLDADGHEVVTGGAARECHMDVTGNAGLMPRNVADVILFRNAARVRDFKLDPDMLDWTHVIGVSDAPTVPALENPASSPTIHPAIDTVADFLARDTSGDE